MGQDSNMYTKITTWVTKKWKALVAFLSVVAAAILFYSRSKRQKEILQKANDSHKKENKANEKAKIDLVKGLEDISKTALDDMESTLKNNEQNKADLEKRKKDFVEKSIDNPDLAKDIADKIGADFVETKDE